MSGQLQRVAADMAQDQVPGQFRSEPETTNARPGASPNGSSPSGRDRRADPTGEAAFGDRYRDAALGNVMGIVERS